MTISNEILQRTLDLAIQIQQTPSPTFAEAQRAQLLQTLFEREGLAEVGRDSIGNVYGRFSTPTQTAHARPLVVSAHLDTVFPIGTDLHLTQTPDHLAGPGIGDNSIGLASLLGLLWILRQDNIHLPGDLWLVANVGEEGLGNLNGMKAVVDRFQNSSLAYIIIEGMGLGEIFHRGLGVQRYRITVQTAGGHSWIDYGKPSAIHELARLVNRLSNLSLPTEPRTTLNVGVIGGGTSINTIASQAFLELDLRSEDTGELKKLVSQVEALASRANRPGVTVEPGIIGTRPSGSIPADHWLVRLAGSCLQDQDILPVSGIGSTDANIPLSRGLPAVCIGLTHGSGAHTLGEIIHTPPLAQGLAQLARLVTQAWSWENSPQP